MNISSQDHQPVRAFVLIGVVLLIATQAYAQNANARLSLTLQNATLKEFVKRIENSTGFSFIYGEEISVKHKINLKAKDKTLKEILELVFKDEQVNYQFSGRYILLQKKKEKKTISRKFTVSGYITDGTSSETLIGVNIVESHRRRNRIAFLLSGLRNKQALIRPSEGYGIEYQDEGRQPTARGARCFQQIGSREPCHTDGCH